MRSFYWDNETAPPKLDSERFAADNSGERGRAWSPSANAAAPNAESGDTLAEQLDEIIVTAQKRTERLQEVPLSVSSMNATTLLERNKLSARDYLTQVPGVALDEVGAGQDQLTIRGIATGYGTNPGRHHH